MEQSSFLTKLRIVSRLCMCLCMCMYVCVCVFNWICKKHGTGEELAPDKTTSLCIMYVCMYVYMCFVYSNMSETTHPEVRMYVCMCFVCINVSSTWRWRTHACVRHASWYNSSMWSPYMQKQIHTYTHTYIDVLHIHMHIVYIRGRF